MSADTRIMDELYKTIDDLKTEIRILEDDKMDLIMYLEEASLKIDGFSAILAGLTCSKDIGVETLVSAVGSVSFSLDELKKYIDQSMEEK